jgi:hypothetical protein
MTCEEIRDLAPEIALGIADGEERAEALRHLSTCADCRRVVEQLSQVADELLVLAPAQEPPPGFESRVVDAIGLGRPTAPTPGPLVDPALGGATAWPGPGDGGRDGSCAGRRLPRRPADRRALPRDPGAGRRPVLPGRAADGRDGRSSRGRVRLRGLALLATRHGRPQAPRRRHEGGARDHEGTDDLASLTRARSQGQLGRRHSRQPLQACLDPPAWRKPWEALQASFPQSVRERN